MFGIARRLLQHALEQGRVDDRARRRLGMGRLQLTDEALDRVEALAVVEATVIALRQALDALPEDQRTAVEARVVDEREYAEITAATGTTEPALRKRVSRGLAGLRARMDRGETR